MHQNSAETTGVDLLGVDSHSAHCVACGASFKLRRKWQRFCSKPCREAYHAKLSPEALRRDIDELRRQVAALQQAALE